MKKSATILLIVVLSSIGILTQNAGAATPAQVATAIQGAVAYLATQQNTTTGVFTCNGYSASYSRACTGASVFAMLNAKAYWPPANAADYASRVTKGINYLLSSASIVNVSTRSDGFNICPSGSGSCNGIIWQEGGETTYSTGIVTGAIDAYGLAQGVGAVATATGALAGMTYGQISQGITNAFAAAQSTIVNNATYGYYGGWRYSLPADGDADSSTTQWAVYAFIFNESLGAVTPASTKTILKHYLDTAQFPAGSGTNSGGVCYTPPSSFGSCSIGPTVSDTGGWLLAEQWIGTPSTDPKVQLAINWLNQNAIWQSNGSSTSSWLGNFNQPYAMLATYKGLESSIGTTTTTGITNLLTPTCGGPASPPTNPCNWYQDYTQSLVATQNPGDGHWDGSQFWTGTLATAFDVTILSAATIPVNSPAPILSVPVMSTVGLILMAILLAGYGALKVRKERPQHTH